jgi:hypothetical protein
VQVDQAGHDDLAGGVDDLVPVAGRAGVGTLADRGDRSPSSTTCPPKCTSSVSLMVSTVPPV